MKFIPALNRYFALDPAQKEFIRTGKRTFNMRPSDMLRFFKPLACFDDNLDAARWQLLKFFIFGLIFSFVGLIMLSNDVFTSRHSVNAYWLFVFATFGCILMRWFLGTLDVHNNLRNFVVPVINALNQDMTADQVMLLKLDLSGKLVKSKLISHEKKNPGWFQYPKVTTWIYKDPWFICRSQLLDGSNLEIIIEDTIRQRRVTRPSSGGKIKSKTKTKIKHRIRATLALKNKTYSIEDQSSLEKGCDRLKVKDKPRRKAVTMIDTQITTDVDASLEPMSCLSIIGKIFMGASNMATKGS